MIRTEINHPARLCRDRPPVRAGHKTEFRVQKGYSHPLPPGGPKDKPRWRQAISRFLRSGFNVAGLKHVDLDENAESAEIFVLSGIFLAGIIVGVIWILLQDYFEPTL